MHVTSMTALSMNTWLGQFVARAENGDGFDLPGLTWVDFLEEALDAVSEESPEEAPKKVRCLIPTECLFVVSEKCSFL